MGIKLALKTLKYEMLLLFDDGVVVIVVVATNTAAADVTISSDFCVCYQCSCCEKRIVFVKTIGKCNWICLCLFFVTDFLMHPKVNMLETKWKPQLYIAYTKYFGLPIFAKAPFGIMRNYKFTTVPNLLRYLHSTSQSVNICTRTKAQNACLPKQHVSILVGVYFLRQFCSSRVIISR